MPPYSAYGDKKTSDFEEDHLISLELGGNPTDPKNLWPEPWDGPYGAHVKDKIENKLHKLVCSGALSLSTAQHLIATSWYAAYLKYAANDSSLSGYSDDADDAALPAATNSPQPSIAPLPVISLSSSPSPQSSSTSGAIPAITWPAGATAKCNDGTYSDAVSHKGDCSHHGGVALFKP